MRDPGRNWSGTGSRRGLFLGDDLPDDDHEQLPGYAPEPVATPTQEAGPARRAPLGGLAAAVAALMVGLLAGVVFGGWERSRLEDELAEATELRERIETDLASLRGRLGQLDHERASLDAERAELVEEITVLEHQLDGLRDRVVLPDFTGAHLAEASARVEEAGWGLEVLHEESLLSPGTVLAQSPPAGGLLRHRSTVRLTVAAPGPTTWSTLHVFEGEGRRTTGPFELPEVEVGRLRLTYVFSDAESRSIVLYSGDEQDALVLAGGGSPVLGTAMLDRAGTYEFEACCGHWRIEVQLAQ